MANGYRNALVQQIKDAGQELINRAESMVHPENDLITDFSIVIHFEQHEVPTIDYTTISMGSKPQQSSRRLTGHGLCISTETPIIGSIGS